MFTRIVPRITPFLLAFLIFAVVSPVTASAASGSYILLTLDKINGESKVAKATKGAIDISSFQFGAANSVVHNGGGSGAGKPTVSDFSFTKYQDSASLSLLESLLSGKAIKNGTVTFYSGGENSKPYLTIKLEDIFVTNDSYSASDGSDRMAESFSLSAGKMTFTYTPTGPKGESLPAQTIVYDVSNNTTGK